MTQQRDELHNLVALQGASQSTFNEALHPIEISLTPEEVDDDRLVLTFISRVGSADGGYDPDNVRHRRDVLRILSGMLLSLPQNLRPANPLNNNQKILTLGLAAPDDAPILVDAGYANTPPIGVRVGKKIWKIDLDDLEGLSCLEILFKKIQEENQALPVQDKKFIYLAP